MATEQSNWAMRALAVAGGLSLVLVLVNIVLSTGNLDLQREVNARQQRINEAIRLNAVNNRLVQLLAATAARTDDADLRNLLARHGITYSVAPQGQAPATGEPAAPAPNPPPAGGTR